ncbi:MAG: hypothetical protein KF832_08265 [Caldilineaceae bacterium]|nr:hypothetical protein [Caldilineaceae bacterium]
MNEQRPQLNSISYGVIILTVTTALIHLYLSFLFPGGPDPAFLLNGIGYLVLLAAIYAPLRLLKPYRALFFWLLLTYTALTFGLWVFLGTKSVWYAYVDKVVELCLILLIWLELRRLPDE